MALDLRESWFRHLDRAPATPPPRSASAPTSTARRPRHPRRPPRLGAAPRRPVVRRTRGRPASRHDRARAGAAARVPGPGARSAASRAHHSRASPCTPTASARSRSGPTTPALGGRVIVRWAPFSWREEDEPVISHPHDPFARIDVLPQRPARAGDRRRHGARRVRPAGRADRDEPAGAVVPAARRRPDGPAHAVADPHPVRLQGHRVVPQRRGRARRRLVLSRPAARRAAGQGPALLLARRHRRGRRRAGTDRACPASEPTTPTSTPSRCGSRPTASTSSGTPTRTTGASTPQRGGTTPTTTSTGCCSASGSGCCSSVRWSGRYGCSSCSSPGSAPRSRSGGSSPSGTRSSGTAPSSTPPTPTPSVTRRSAPWAASPRPFSSPGAPATA